VTATIPLPLQDPYVALKVGAEALGEEIAASPFGADGFRAWLADVEAARLLDGLSARDVGTVSLGVTFGYIEGPEFIARMLHGPLSRGRGAVQQRAARS